MTARGIYAVLHTIIIVGVQNVDWSHFHFIQAYHLEIVTKIFRTWLTFMQTDSG